ncbi:MAG: tetratricopeptide repeat protein [Rhodospirillales bacterium]|nr:tetratricopeptide repeat protein [Rhodospirillales bacterium]
MASLELDLLGGFGARFGTGEPLVALGRKAQLLLAFLALRAGEAQTREKVIGVLWSDRGDAQARGSLRQELTVLRKTLGSLEPAPIVIDGERLSLAAGAVAVDVRRFEELIQSDATADLERAVALYKGPFLDGLAVRDSACEEWLLHERERLRLLMLGVLDRLLARQMKAGALAPATATAEAILAQDPLREDMHRTLMQLHAAQGRHGLALKQYRLCKETLARELGVAPEPETERLHQEIQAQRTAPSRPSATVSPVAPDTGPVSAIIAPPFLGSGGGDAYEFYLMGRSFFLRNVWGKGALEAARRLFAQAIEIDPHYARAYAGLANCDCYRLLLGVPGVSFDTIAANSTRALELGPALAESHAARGLALYTAGQHVAAVAAFEQAVKLGPELFEAHYFSARNWRAQGRHEKAAPLFERAAALNQNDFRALGLLVDEYRALGRLDDSLAAARQCLDRITVEVATQPDDGYALAFGSNILAELGERARAEEWATRALRIDPDNAIVNYNLACTYAALGRPGAALDRLRKTFATVPINRRAFFEWMQHDSALDPLRDHAEFRALDAQLAAEIAASVPEPPVALPAARAPDRRPAIAVLPFANISGDPEQEYFADGLTEDIITDLSQVSALFVVARNTVFSYKGRSVEVREAARALNVGHILEGSVRKAGDRLRITVQLVDGRTGGHLWANRYDRSLDDIFALQDEISQSIVDALKVKLLPEERALIASRSTTSPEAYQYYLMGRSFFLRSGWGRRALAVARQMFAKAAELDPRYARAFAGIANCDSTLLCMGDPGVSFEEILANSARALELDADLAEAHAAKGLALYTAGRHAEANAALEQAVRLGPTLFEAHFFAGRNCRAQGRYPEAAALLERAAELQPDDFRALGLAVNAYRSLGRRDDLLSAARRCLERVEAEIAVHPDNAGALAFGAAVLAELGEAGRAEAWAARAAMIDSIDSITNYNLACAFVGLGKLDEGLARLEQVFSDPPFSRRSHVEWMKHDSSFEPLRGHPGYQALLARLEAETERESPARATGPRPAIAMLPFDNLSGDPGQDYFADGIVEEITAALARARSFFVIARSSTLRYRGRSVEPPQVGRELGVCYLLQGSVRISGDRVRIAAQLIEAATAACIWVDRYEGRREDVFDLEDRITERIVGALEPTIRSAEIERARRKRPDSLEAYDYVMRALPHMLALTPEASAEALRLTLEAVRLDPDYARANALAAWCHAWQVVNGWAPSPQESRAEGMRLARAAIRLDADDPGVLTKVGATEMLLAGDLESASAHIARALALDPNSAWAWIRSGYLHAYRGEPETALAHFERAAQLSPFDPLNFNRYAGVALAHLVAARYEEAIAWAEKARVERPGLPFAYRILATAHVQLGQQEQAREAAQVLLARCPRQSLAEMMAVTPFRDGNVRRRFEDGLRQAGIPDVVSTTAADRPAIAVLPFDNLSGDPGQEYFSDGLTEDLITALAHWRSFPVIARNSTFAYKRRTVDAKQVARKLGARYVLEGSVRRDGNRVRVTAQLIDGDSGHHLWAERYDRELGDLFALQDELSQRICALIAPELERDGIKRAAAKRPADLGAWDYYLRGTAFLQQFTKDGNARAREMFAQAIALDPDYADAHAALAVSYNRDLLLQCAEDRAEATRQAMAAARRAVALDPASSAAHAALATAHLWRDEHDLSLAEARQAVELNPNDALAVHALGNKSDLVGDPQGIARMERAQQLNPHDPERHSHLCFLARAYVNARRYAEAAVAAEAAIQRRPDYPHAHFILAIALGHLGRAAEARHALAECERLQPGFVAARADWRPYTDEAANAHLREGLSKAAAAAVARPAAALA